MARPWQGVFRLRNVRQRTGRRWDVAGIAIMPSLASAAADAHLSRLLNTSTWKHLRGLSSRQDVLSHGGL